MKQLERAWWGESTTSLSPVCWTGYWLSLSHQKSLPSWSTCLVQGTQEEGQVWQQMGTALAMHVTYCTFLHSPWSSPAAAAALQKLLKDPLEGVRFSLSYFPCPAIHNTFFCFLFTLSTQILSLPIFNLFLEETPVDVFSLPSSLLLFYWLTESLYLKVRFFSPLPFAFSLCNPTTSLIGKCQTGSELFLIQCWEVELAEVQFCAEQLTVAQ